MIQVQPLGNILEKIQAKWHTYISRFPAEKVYLRNDKSLYRPGETIWFSVFVRNADLTAASQSDVVYVELINPKGTIEKSCKVVQQNGVAKGDFLLEKSIAGGLYKLKAYTWWQKNDANPAIFEKEIQVQEIVLPRLKMNLDFVKESYSAGEEVTCILKAETNENAPLAKQKIAFSVQIAAEIGEMQKMETDEKGQANIRFSLPKKLETSDALLNITTEYQGQTEAISRAVPVNLNFVKVEFFPEGGDLVADLPCKVAFRVLNEKGKPADASGYIVDSKETKVADFQSENKSMGTFSFTPHKHETYKAHITNPTKVATIFQLPKIKNEGFSLQIIENSPSKIKLSVYASEKNELHVMANMQEKNIFSHSYRVTEGQNFIEIPTQNLPMGVAQITLFDNKGNPQAERLALVNGHKKLNVDISIEKDKFLPREKVTTNLEVTDENGKPVVAHFALSVVNDQLLSFADDKSSDIFSWLLVENELKDKIHEPHFYFDEKESLEKRTKTLDNLLMTAGWRRFTWADIEEKEKPIWYDADKTEIRGTVVRADVSKAWIPQAGAKIEIEGMKGTVFTNEKGEFHIKHVPIPTKIKASFENKESNQTISYLTNYNNWIYLAEKKEPIPQPKIEAKTIVKPTAVPTFAGGSGKISGRVIDNQGKPAEGAEVRLSVGEDIVNGAITDEKGEYSIQPIDAGDYDLEVLYLDMAQKITGVPVISGITRYVDVDLGGGRILAIEKGNPAQRKVIKMEAKAIPQNIPPSKQKVVVAAAAQEEVGEALATSVVQGKQDFQTKEVVITAFKNPSFEKDPNAQGTILSQNQIKNKATRNINAVAAMTAGVYQQDEGDFALSFRGAREGGTQYIVDGVKVRGTPNIPQSAIGQMQVYTGGTPAEFGDFTGGVINITTTSSAYRPAFPDRNRYTTSNTSCTCAVCTANRNNYINGVAKPAKPNYSFATAREFANPIYAENEKVTEREDFRSTIYWNGDVATDEKGKASVSFYTSDEITSFRIIAEGISEEGKLGKGEKVFFTQLPFSLSAKLPVELVMEDKFILPITLVNNTNETLSGLLQIQVPSAMIATDSGQSFVSVAPHQAQTFYKSYQVLTQENRYANSFIQVKFSAAGLDDAIKQPIRILHKGFPVMISASGQEQAQTFEFEVINPVNGTISANFEAYPDMLEQMLSGIEGMLREPHGCFEQTSSSTYPNILVLNYLKETGQLKPEIEKKALTLIETGYKRLISFECKNKGFEWFGGDPAHEGLTAYGVLEFTDMKKVWGGVDEKMLQRTQNWLLSRRDGKGGFARNPHALHQFGMSDQNAMNAYIVWALSENKMEGLEKEVQTCYEQALKAENPYQLALVANIMYNYGRNEEAKSIISLLLQKQNPENQWIHAAYFHSAPGSEGVGLSVETSALALMAMLKSAQKDWTNIRNMANNICKNRSGYGMFGNTNSTVLALRALTMFAKESKKTAEDGKIELFADGKKVGEANYQKGIVGKITISDLEAHFPQGKHQLSVKYVGTNNPLPYTFQLAHYTSLPLSSPDCKVKLETNLVKKHFKIGETARLNVVLSNTKNEGLAMTIATIGIPAGLVLQPWQLKEMQEKGIFDYYETEGNTLILYYRQMKPLEIKEINLDLRVELAGKYASPASSAYLYYTNEFKSWTSAGEVEIVP